MASLFLCARGEREREKGSTGTAQGKEQCRLDAAPFDQLSAKKVSECRAQPASGNVDQGLSLELVPGREMIGDIIHGGGRIKGELEKLHGIAEVDEADGGRKVENKEFEDLSGRCGAEEKAAAELFTQAGNQCHPRQLKHGGEGQTGSDGAGCAADLADKCIAVGVGDSVC